MCTLTLEREVLLSSRDQIKEFVCPLKINIPHLFEEKGMCLKNRKLNSNFDWGSPSSMYYKYRASYF